MPNPRGGRLAEAGRRWRKALNVVRTLLRWLAPVRVLPLSASYVAIDMNDGNKPDADAATHIRYETPGADVRIDILGAAAHSFNFKSLVKEKRQCSFRRLGGAAEIAALLNSHPERGIDERVYDMRCRKAQHGENTYPESKPRGFFIHFRDAHRDVFLVALLACSVISLAFGIKEHRLREGCYDGAGIFLAVLLVSGLSAHSTHNQDKRAHNDASDSAKITVSRDAGTRVVLIFDVVVGDVVILHTGDTVPADGVFLNGHDLHVDETDITGEPQAIEINAENSPFLAAGVKVICGHGSMLVTAVGTNTSWGGPWSSLSTMSIHPEPLRTRVESIISTVTKVGQAATVVTVTVLAARHFTGSAAGKLPLLDKGVPLAVALMITFSMKRVLKDNALVHHLSALETMASVTVICICTGRLTHNEMKATNEACAKAGVAVKMLTADDIAASRAVATECGIISSNDTGDVTIITGPEFRNMPHARQVERVDEIRVIAMSGPLDKLVLEKRLKKKGHVLAEGTNDKSDEVITAIQSGRCMYNNFQKIIQFYLTVNIVATVVDFVAAITACDAPLSSVQLLWVNLAMGALGALALAADTPTDALMDGPPIARTAPLISDAMWRNLIAQAGFQIAVLLVLQHLAAQDNKGTVVFNVFMLFQVFNQFNVRGVEKKNAFAGVLKNKMFLVIITLMFVLQVVTMEVLTRFVGAKKLGLWQWGACVAVAAGSCTVGWAVKFIPVPVGSLTRLAF
ncbi:hypothetical protein CFC21_001699 [Triticum aestivum]|uniref:Cation-transporting P-type ATPase N-terminal domain-containing protein n=1 Tax=Triticum aestivum TaxID=4565 RepID=A0A3B5XZE7_WHEAT|nr:calcium-transporting ATPase 7, plasma membrane-type-like [Triticum aestivum]KAF6983524.1 hypothetical protein CFC21_001699 [Triticum aestivum]